MRNSTPYILAATLLIAGPAAAQDNATPATATDTAAADPGVSTTNNLDSDTAIATGTTNGLTAGPGTAPATTDTMATDPAYGAPVEQEDDDRFPWGLLGLLGLAGLIPRKPRERRHDGAI